MTKQFLLAATALASLALGATAALADEAPKSWTSGITATGQIDAGITANTASPANRLNFGSLFTDKANTPLLNQAAATLSRTIDPKETGFDVGFKLQGMYGADARYTHFLGEFDRVTKAQNQFDIVEANVTLHLPYITEGGVDLKLGQFSTPMGAETIDPSTNAFYSHSYIFNFGLPFKQTGGYAALHLTPVVDLYLGADTGLNTSFGKTGDNNNSQSFMFGFGLNLLDGNLTVLALTHAGPETPTLTTRRAANFQRYLNDVVVIYKPTDKLTLTTELNYAKDEFARAEAWGIAQYAGYALTDTLTLNARAEVYRDGQGFFVGAFPGNMDFLNAEAGRPATVVGGTRTTYGEATFGVTYKPALTGPLTGLLVRPEVRIDSALNGTKPYNGGRDSKAVTLATDFILQF